MHCFTSLISPRSARRQLPRAIQYGGSPPAPIGVAGSVLPVREGGVRVAADGTILPGLRVFPVKGRAIMFWSRLPSGAEDAASLHAAEPVVEGQKWIVTRWFTSAD